MKITTLLTGNKEAAQQDLADFCELTPEQRQRLAADPDRFIDEEMGGDCCGETRALLNGFAERSFWHVLFVTGPVLILVMVAGALLSTHYRSMAPAGISFLVGMGWIWYDVIHFSRE